MAERSLNKVMIIGRLGRDPEVRYLPSGQAVTNFSVATSERFQDKEGEWKERTEWHRIVLFGKLAETAGQYLNKGRRVYIEGRLQTRDWETQDGEKRKTTEIVGRDVLFLGGRGEDTGESIEQEASQEPPADDVPF